eukprot:764143-Hanusia_phi.AAC.5
MMVGVRYRLKNTRTGGVKSPSNDGVMSYSCFNGEWEGSHHARSQNVRKVRGSFTEKMGVQLRECPGGRWSIVGNRSK